MKIAHYLALTALMLCLLTPTTTASRCLGLAFEGAQDLGAWEAGVFKGLTEASKPEDVQYDVVGGVSTGALNALGIAMYAKGQEAEAADYLVNFWRNLDSSDVYENWSFGLIQGVVEKGFYNNEPFRGTLRDFYHTEKLQRGFTATITNYDSGEPETYTENHFKSTLENVLMAS